MQLLWPDSPAHAQALRDAHPGARFVAGATALQQEWGDRHRAPQGCCLVPLHALEALRGIGLADGGRTLRIGAGCALETVRTHPLVIAHAPLLAQALDQLGALGVRHLGTLGGNVGWRWGDSTPALLVLDAQAEGVLAPDQRLPLAQWLAAPVPALPLLAALHIPLLPGCQPPQAVFEKAAVRAAFAPARLRLALRWSGIPACGRTLSHAAAAAPGLPARLLVHALAWLQQNAGLHGAWALDGLREACADDGLPIGHPEDLAHLAARLIAGHCGLLAPAPLP
ncbi:FAD binding domain-containing protein [Comamonas antarctica]|uniref:FAD binding domain-containing protein n=1 Tax=Comamonas antarctica TaxID=2743470 RepID=A0A6N1X187_9BURK|nr:FAD binding domain-containing protein [Comamonas antarctica]QKV53071.1 FAD binding domain-containing protein [Comamonas antarctica]